MAFRPLPRPQVLSTSEPAQNFIAAMQAKREKERKEQEAERAGRKEEREVEKFGMEKGLLESKEERAIEKFKMEKEAASVDITRKRREEISKFTQEQLLSLDPDDPEFDQKKMQIADEVGNYAHSIGISAQEITEGAKRFITGYTPEVAKQFRIKAGMAAEEDNGKYAPSSIMKMYNEVNDLIGKGVSPDSDIVKALQAKISGQEVDPATLTNDAVDMLGTMYSYTGKLPALGRGKAATEMRARIYARAAEIAKEKIGGPDIKPTDIGLKVLAESSDTKAIQGSLNMLDKQINSMESFAINLEKQVDRVKEKTKGLKTYDTRLFNVPLRTLRGKVKGSPEQAIYDMYVTEIEAEIGKIATGSTQSIAELSTSAQEKWAKIHDKNLSWNDMVKLLDESSHAAKMRVASVKAQQQVAKDRMARKDEGGKLKPGTVEDGYRFKGGDPADKNSWEKM